MTKEKIGKFMFYSVRTAGLLLFLLVPWASYIGFELVTGNLSSISPCLAVNAGLWLVPGRVRGWRQRLLLGCGSAIAVAVSVMRFYGHIVPENGMELNMWSMNDTYERCGYLLSTALSLKYIVKIRAGAGQSAADALQPVPPKSVKGASGDPFHRLLRGRRDVLWMG